MDDTDNLYFGIGLVGVLGILGAFTVKNIMDKKDGIKLLSAAAQSAAQRAGIPLSIIVTQAAHESNYGRSSLATKSNNLFGIKAQTGYIGQFDIWPTYEVIAGKEIKVDARFRKYSSWSASVDDWVKFIQGPRYAKAYAAALDGKATLFFQELQKAGYATDPNYASQLVAVYKSLSEVLA